MNINDTMELKPVQNGYIISITTDEHEVREYVFDSFNKALRFVKINLAEEPDEPVK